MHHPRLCLALVVLLAAGALLAVRPVPASDQPYSTGGPSLQRELRPADLPPG